MRASRMVVTVAVLLVAGCSGSDEGVADLVKLVDAEVEDAFSFNARGHRLGIKQSIWLQNLLGEKAVFLLKRKH